MSLIESDFAAGFVAGDDDSFPISPCSDHRLNTRRGQARPKRNIRAGAEALADVNRRNECGRYVDRKRQLL